MSSAAQKRFFQRYKWGFIFAGIYLIVGIVCNVLLLLRVDPLGWGEYNILRMIMYYASMPTVLLLQDMLRTFYDSAGWIILGATAPLYFAAGQLVGYIVGDITGHRTLGKDTTTKSERIRKWLFIMFITWMGICAAVGGLTSSGTGTVTKSPDGKKEFYIYWPFYRRVIHGMMYPVEWSVNLVTALLPDTPDSCISFAARSLYVRDNASGCSRRYHSQSPTGVWSPDSRWIACEGPRKNEQCPLLLVDSEQRKEYVLFSPNAPRNSGIGKITWSSDGTSVFFCQRNTVYAVDIASKSIVVIAADVKSDSVDRLLEQVK